MDVDDLIRKYGDSDEHIISSPINLDRTWSPSRGSYGTPSKVLGRLEEERNQLVMLAYKRTARMMAARGDGDTENFTSPTVASPNYYPIKLSPRSELSDSDSPTSTPRLLPKFKPRATTPNISRAKQDISVNFSRSLTPNSTRSYSPNVLDIQLEHRKQIELDKHQREVLRSTRPYITTRTEDITTPRSTTSIDPPYISPRHVHPLLSNNSFSKYSDVERYSPNRMSYNRSTTPTTIIRPTPTSAFSKIESTQNNPTYTEEHWQGIVWKQATVMNPNTQIPPPKKPLISHASLPNPLTIGQTLTPIIVLNDNTPRESLAMIRHTWYMCWNPNPSNLNSSSSFTPTSSSNNSDEPPGSPSQRLSSGVFLGNQSHLKIESKMEGAYIQVVLQSDFGDSLLVMSTSPVSPVVPVVGMDNASSRRETKNQIIQFADVKPKPKAAKERSPSTPNYSIMLSSSEIVLDIEGDAVEGNILTAKISNRNGAMIPSGRLSWYRGSELVIQDTYTYTLTKADIGKPVVCEFETHDKKIRARTMSAFVMESEPRVLSLEIVGVLQVPNLLKLEATYVGGIEGNSSISWIRSLNSGSQVVSRVNTYRLTSNDIGATIICTYTPIRSDGKQGKQSKVVGIHPVKPPPDPP